VRSARAEIGCRGHQAATGDWRAKPDAEAPRYAEGRPAKAASGGRRPEPAVGLRSVGRDGGEVRWLEGRRTASGGHQVGHRVDANGGAEAYTMAAEDGLVEWRVSPW
jgi:hypothetical protein